MNRMYKALGAAALGIGLLVSNPAHGLDGKVDQLTATYTTQGRQGYKYFYNVELKSNGPEVEIVGGERCFKVTGNCYKLSPSFTVPAGGSVTRSNQYFQTLNADDEATYTYKGKKGEEAYFTISTKEY